MRARRALGLPNSTRESALDPLNNVAVAFQSADRGSPNRKPRHFVKDGEVPVEYANGTAGAAARERLLKAEQSLEVERQARLRAERALAEAESALRETQTQLGHARLARDEAAEDARRFSMERDEFAAKLKAEREARALAELVRDIAADRVQVL